MKNLYQVGIGFALLIAFALLLWPQQTRERDHAASSLAMPSASVTTIESFFQFAWGMSRAEVLDQAAKSKLQPTPPGFLDYRGTDLLYNVSVAGCPSVLRFSFRELPDQKLSALYKGTLSISDKNCPIEKLFQQQQAELTKKYGPVPDHGYPARRNSDIEKPWHPGSGMVWEIKAGDGQLFEITAELNQSDSGLLRISYHNVSIDRRYKELRTPTPPGDPAQAESALKGFLDVPWGATPAMFQARMTEHGFSVLTEKTSPINRSAHSAFGQGRFAGFPIASVDAYFKHGQMHMVSVSIKGDATDNGQATYNKAKDFLQQQYGAPLEQKNFQQEIVHVWPFALAGFKPNHIMLHKSGSAVMILYQNRALEDKLNNL